MKYLPSSQSMALAATRQTPAQLLGLPLSSEAGAAPHTPSCQSESQQRRELSACLAGCTRGSASPPLPLAKAWQPGAHPQSPAPAFQMYSSCCERSGQDSCGNRQFSPSAPAQRPGERGLRAAGAFTCPAPAPVSGWGASACCGSSQGSAWELQHLEQPAEDPAPTGLGQLGTAGAHPPALGRGVDEGWSRWFGPLPGDSTLGQRPPELSWSSPCQAWRFALSPPGPRALWPWTHPGVSARSGPWGPGSRAEPPPLHENRAGGSQTPETLSHPCKGRAMGEHEGAPCPAWPPEKASSSPALTPPPSGRWAAGRDPAALPRQPSHPARPPAQCQAKG